MPSTRLPRFQRSPDVAPFQLTERDKEILRLVYRHRFLRSSHICALISGSSQQILRRLKSLYHHGYLSRPRAQVDYYHHGGSSQMVYCLGNNGLSLLKDELVEMFRFAPWDEGNDSDRRVFLKHALLVSDIMVSVELACRANGIRLLMEPELAKANQPFRWKTNVQGQRFSVAPDRVFALEFQGSDENTRRSYFFLEADRGTMPVTRKTLSQTSFHRKLVAYEATWKEGIHEKRFGFNRFRVLTVTTGPERVKSLLTACTQLKTGHGLFLFADRTILENSQAILLHSWQTGRAGQTGTLLD
ncbi:MAG TPA: replication-relaxation family protein [Candidatus Angelobacter sp.]|nr:replication-relaxation family protein [Candidatus Angelobacter sp.]